MTGKAEQETFWAEAFQTRLPLDQLSAGPSVYLQWVLNYKLHFQSLIGLEVEFFLFNFCGRIGVTPCANETLD